MGINLLSAPAIVPANFVGLCTTAITNAPNTISFSRVRSWDYQGDQGQAARCVMCNINPSSGTYVWTTFDELCSNNTGKQFIFTLGAPADYLVTRSAVGGAYLGGKSNMCPDDLSGYCTAVQAVVSRAKNTWGITGAIWELFNEIDQTSTYNDSVSLLGPYTKAVAQAILAIDSTAIVISPSISGASHLSTLQSYLTASDGAAGTSATWLQGVALHYYAQSIYGYDHPINYCQSYSLVESYISSLGLSLPIYITESGVKSTSPTIPGILQRRMVSFAALGAKCFLGYSYDLSTYQISPYASQWNTVAGLLVPGASISSFIPGVASAQVTINGTPYTF